MSKRGAGLAIALVAFALFGLAAALYWHRREAPQAVSSATDADSSAALIQALREADEEIQNGPRAIIDLPGDPVIVPRKSDATILSTTVALRHTLDKAEPVQSSQIYFFQVPLVPPSAELDGAVEVLSASIANAPPNDATSDAIPGADGADQDSQDLVDNVPLDMSPQTALDQASAPPQPRGRDADTTWLDIGLGDADEPLVRRSVIHVTDVQPLSTLIVRAGFSVESAELVAAAALQHFRVRTILAGSTLVVRGTRNTAGVYSVMQASIYDQSEYVGTIASSEGGGYDEGAEPALDPSDLAPASASVAPGRAYSVLDGIVAAGVRADLSEQAIRQIASLLAKKVDQKARVRDGDTIKIMFGRPEPGNNNRIETLYIGIRTANSDVECYVMRTKGAAFQCLDDRAMVQEGQVFAPVEGAPITSTFGMRVHPILGIKRLHAGVDWAAKIGTPIRSIADGVVSFEGLLSDFGNHIRLRHGGDGIGQGRGVLDTFLEAGIMAESGNNPNAQNSLSSAGGLGQFIDSTWIAIVRRHAPEVATGKSDAELLAMKKGHETADLQRRMTRAYAEDNLAVLSSAGIEISPASLYAAHFLGVGLAVKVLQSPDTSSMSVFLSAQAVAANPKQGAMSVGTFRQWLVARMGRSVGGYETSYSHLDRFAPALHVGDKVKKGEVIGFVGTTGLSTGPHLHFQYYRGGAAVDPLLYMEKQTQTLSAAEREVFDDNRSALRNVLASVGMLPSRSDGTKGQ